MDKSPQNDSDPFAYRRQKLAAAAKRKKMLQYAGIVAAVLVAGGLLLWVLLRDAGADKPTGGDTTAGDAAGDTAADETDAGEPTATPESTPPPIDEDVLAAAAGVSRTTPEDRIAAVAAETEALCAGGTPAVIHDPDGWEDAGKALMEQLESDPVYKDAGFAPSVDGVRAARTDAISAISRWQETTGLQLPDEYPYLIAVNRAADTVTVYAPDSDGRYTVPYMAMVCSTGPDTPAGYFYTPINYGWQMLYGPCYGQYATRIVNSILFHSVPYYTQHQDDLEYDQYNRLGTPDSLGCIRLAVRDVLWIYKHCPIGTPVVIYDIAEDPGPMGKPGTIHIDPANESLRGWDPTDPNPENPWPAEYRRGTTILSDAAKADLAAEEADGAWPGSLNSTDLQGFSTDSSVEGTRG